MLMPKRVKYRRVQRGRLKGKATARQHASPTVTYGLVALEPAWITSNQIEAARIAMTRYIKRGGTGMDQDIPRQAYHREACRDPNGFR